jgi:hypothetical protein
MSTALERRAERFIKKRLARSGLKLSPSRSNAEKSDLGDWCIVDPFRQIVVGASVKAHNTGPTMGHREQMKMEKIMETNPTYKFPLKAKYTKGLEQNVTRPTLKGNKKVHAICEHLPLLSLGWKTKAHAITYCVYVVRTSIVCRLSQLLVESIDTLWPASPVVPAGVLSGGTCGGTQ